MQRKYYVGHYRYAGQRLQVACVRNVDYLPPTMYTCMSTVVASNKREAVALWRKSLACDHRVRRA